MPVIVEDIKLDYNDVLIRPKRSVLTSRRDVNLTRRFKFPNSGATWEGVPIIAANMDTIGTFGTFKVFSKHKILCALHKYYTADDYEEFARENVDCNGSSLLDPNYFMVSTGISDSDFDRLCDICSRIDAKFICIDVANGYMETLVQFCLKCREMFPNKIIVAGNVVSRELTEDLILRGKVDIVKVGIGPGSACTTRSQTGVGMPQLSAIMECADAAHGTSRGFVIGDGGITCPGDVAKGFGGGADFIMIGGQFGGHDENPGELVTLRDNVTGDVNKFKEFYGMSSSRAMEKHSGGMASYRSSEGRVLKIKYKGALEDTINNFLGGLRSTCTYINASNIKNIPKCTTFIKVNRQLNTIFA